MGGWVAERTSDLSPVRLLPAEIQDVYIQRLGALEMACDELTRRKDVRMNPSAQLALIWHHAGGGRGSRNMINIPYKDRRELSSRNLQQLIMDSVGTERDCRESIVNQRICVFGNKDSTEHNSYIQQLRYGTNDFFRPFLEFLSDGKRSSLHVRGNATTGDYLAGFYLATKRNEVSGIIEPQRGEALNLSEIAQGISKTGTVEHVLKICEPVSANSQSGLRKVSVSSPFGAMYGPTRLFQNCRRRCEESRVSQ